LVISNPKFKLIDQVREVLRVKHQAIRTEQACCDWIRRSGRQVRRPKAEARTKAEARNPRTLMPGRWGKSSAASAV